MMLQGYIPPHIIKQFKNQFYAISMFGPVCSMNFSAFVSLHILYSQLARQGWFDDWILLGTNGK